MKLQRERVRMSIIGAMVSKEKNNNLDINESYEFSIDCGLP